MNEKDYDKIFYEISKGYSVVNLNCGKAFIKHASLKEINSYHETYDYFLEKAKIKKIPTQEELFKSLSETGQWTKVQEDELQQQEAELKNLKQTEKKLFREFEKKPIRNRINEVKKSLKENQDLKNSFVRITAENYAEKKSNEFFIQRCVYEDEELSNLLWTEEEFQELDISSIAEVFNSYHECLAKFSEKNLKQISISGVFRNMIGVFDEDLSNFFNEPLIDSSFYKVNLLNYAKMFTSIFKNKDIPAEISNDADKILNYLDEMSSKKEKAKRILDKSEKSDGFSYAKASKEDLEDIGIRKTGKDIHEIAKEKGGELSMEDFMEMHKK